MSGFFVKHRTVGHESHCVNEKVGTPDATDSCARAHTGTLEVKYQLLSHCRRSGKPTANAEVRTMKASVRRTIEMSKRVLSFSLDHPDPSPGYSAALERLQKAVAEADLLADRQEEGFKARRAATGLKQTLRRRIRRNLLLHVCRVGEAAASEVPELGAKFQLAREAIPYLAFRTAARGILAEAQSRRELMVRHGMLDASVENLVKSLSQFEQAIEQGDTARRAHVGASAELDALADELTQISRLMDGINRARFENDREALAQWQSASNVIGPPRSGGKTDGGKGGQSTPVPPSSENKPAA
jgi:hypothetical protein